MRVGILTSGGDCQALNATMRGLALTLYRNVKDVEIIGFIDGYKGLMYEKYKKIKNCVEKYLRFVICFVAYPLSLQKT